MTKKVRERKLEYQSMNRMYFDLVESGEKMEENKRGQFTFYRSFFEAVSSLPDDVRLKLYDSIANFALNGVEPDLDGIANTIFVLVRPTIVSSNKKSRAGRLGGKKNKQSEINPEAEHKQIESKTEANEKQNESEIEIEKEKELELEKESKIELELEVEDECPLPIPEQNCSETVVALPLKTGEDFSITQDNVKEWEALYSGVDVTQQLFNMRGWLLANKERRKTKRGIMRFVNGWLARENERAVKADQSKAKKQGENVFLEMLGEELEQDG